MEGNEDIREFVSRPRTEKVAIEQCLAASVYLTILQNGSVSKKKKKKLKKNIPPDSSVVSTSTVIFYLSLGPAGASDGSTGEQGSEPAIFLLQLALPDGCSIRHRRMSGDCVVD